MTTIAVKIETVSGAKVEFSHEVFIWDELNQFERDDIISLLVNGNDDANRYYISKHWLYAELVPKAKTRALKDLCRCHSNQ